jgi:hypothetical protein
MESNRYGFLVNIYLLITVVHLFLLQTNMEFYQQLTKVLLVPVLIVYAWSNAAGAARWALVTALLFGWAGDILLLFSERQELFFLLGLGAFLAGHLAYIRSFMLWKDGSGSHQWAPYFGLVAVVSFGRYAGARVVVCGRYFSHDRDGHQEKRRYQYYQLLCCAYRGIVFYRFRLFDSLE